jgi:hypothetical protein
MDHMKILKRAWEITRYYRVLWVFGVILALTSGTFNGGGGGGGSGGDGNNTSWDESQFDLDLSPEAANTLIAIAIGVACLIVFLIVVSVIARYVAQTAVIRMVHEYEDTGERRSVRQGFRLGWSRAARRLFLLDLSIGLPVALVFILLALITLAPLLMWFTGNEAVGALATVATVGLCFLVVILGIVVGVTLSLLLHFFRRVCVLEGLGVVESIQEGYALVRRHLKDVFVMWLIMIGVDIAAMMALVPVFILLAIVGGVLGGLLALLVGGLTSLALSGAAPWIAGGAVGIPIFLLILVAPLAFLGGLVEVFKSSTWTLTYRELRALNGLEIKE